MSFLAPKAPKTRPSQSAIYYELSRFYDSIFSQTLRRGIKETIQALNIHSDANVLDVGVGTGHYLAAYPPRAHVVGIDLSQQMLNQAARRIQNRNWTHIQLLRMDAQDLQFASNTFDSVAALHALTVVEDPKRMVSEMLRVCKPGGALAMINLFRNDNRWLAPFFGAANFVTKRLGWRCNVSYHNLIQDLPIQVEQRSRITPLSPLTMVVGRKPE